MQSADMQPHAMPPLGGFVFPPPSTHERSNKYSTPSRSSSVHGQPPIVRSLSVSGLPAMTLDDYDSLPSSIKSKFFSSTERLHLAQQSAMEGRRRKRSLSVASVTGSSVSTTDRKSRPSTSGGSGVRRLHSRRRQSKSGVVDMDVDKITLEQARWYLNLPDKIRKQQFSREEQISLGMWCRRLVDATAGPDQILDMPHRSLHPLDTSRDDHELRTSLHSTRPLSATTVDTDILDPTALSPVEPEPLLDSIVSLYENGDSPLEAVNPANIPLPESPPPIHDQPSTPAPDRTSAPVHYRRRSRSHLTPMSLPPPQLTPIPPVPPLPPSFQRSSSVATVISIDPTTTEIKSPREDTSTPNSRPYAPADVRSQLRQYLTPEKFDEALEFGFSLPADKPPRSSSTYQSSQPPPLWHQDHYDDGEDSSDSLDTAGPRTPTTVSEHVYPSIKPPSLDSSAEISFRNHFFSTWKTSKAGGRDDGGLGGNREMTLFVTLSRKDDDGGSALGLRPQTSGVTVARRDPLALEALPVCDDPTGAHGAFAVPPPRTTRGFKKVWKTLRGH